MLLLSFLVSAVSGIILFVRPEGSLARWVGWSVLGLDKAQWEAVHIVRARSQGIEVPNTAMTIADIARAHHLSPEAVFQAISRDHDSRLVQP